MPNASFDYTCCECCLNIGSTRARYCTSRLRVNRRLVSVHYSAGGRLYAGKNQYRLPNDEYGKLASRFDIEQTSKVAVFIDYLKQGWVILCMFPSITNKMQRYTIIYFCGDSNRGRYSPHNSEINPTRCNNCVYSSQLLYSTCFG